MGCCYLGCCSQSDSFGLLGEPACCPQVHLARLVVLGWTMDMGPSACVLAAALSLTPSCHVFLTPMNTQGANAAGCEVAAPVAEACPKERTSHSFFTNKRFFVGCRWLGSLKIWRNSTMLVVIFKILMWIMSPQALLIPLKSLWYRNQSFWESLKSIKATDKISKGVVEWPLSTGDLDGYSLSLLQNSISARAKYDGGWLSEPLTIYALCFLAWDWGERCENMRQESLSFCSPREMIFIPEFWKTKKNMSLGGCSVGSKMVVMEGLPFVQAFPVFLKQGSQVAMWVTVNIRTPKS